MVENTVARPDPGPWPDAEDSENNASLALAAARNNQAAISHQAGMFNNAQTIIICGGGFDNVQGSIFNIAGTAGGFRY